MAAFFVLSSHYCGSVSVCAHKNPLWFNISNTLILSSKKHVLWSKVLRSPASIFSYTSINEILRDSNIQSALVLFIVLNIPWLYFYHLFFIFFSFFLPPLIKIAQSHVKQITTQYSFHFSVWPSQGKALLLNWILTIHLFLAYKKVNKLTGNKNKWIPLIWK